MSVSSTGEVDKQKLLVANVERLATDVLASLSMPYEGKAEACESNDAMELLVQLMNSDNLAVQNASVCAVMNITIRKEGKWIALKCGVTQKLVDLLRKGEVNVVFLLKTITNIAEDPQGRKQLQTAMPLIQQLSLNIQQQNMEVSKNNNKNNRDLLLESSVKTALKQLSL